jgi:hypothetical protein
VIDNQPLARQKLIFCVVELLLGLWFLLMAIVSFISAKNDSKYSTRDKLAPMSFFLTSAFEIIMILQLFNWFSKRVLGTVIGLWFST